MSVYVQLVSLQNIHTIVHFMLKILHEQLLLQKAFQQQKIKSSTQLVEAFFYDLGKFE